MTDKILIENIELSFDNAEKGNSKIDNYIKEMEGMSGLKTRHFYNNLLSSKNSKYLEIGTWKGSTICSAMCGNSSKIVCADNWSEFNGPKEEFLKNIEKYSGSNDFNYIESDCFKIDIKKIDKFNIFMYDGNHTYESHYKALTYFIDSMEDYFIFIVDDWNWLNVQKGTFDSIKDLKLEVLWKKEIKLTTDGSTTYDKNGWWNGISVFVLKKNL